MLKQLVDAQQLTSYTYKYAYICMCKFIAEIRGEASVSYRGV